ncbi:MAG: HD-GYP domain-containing protein [Fimbriimonadales bacterium]
MQGAWWALGITIVSILALAYYAFVVLPARIHRWRCEGLRAFARLIELRTGGRFGTAEPMAELAHAVALRLGLPMHERRRMELAVYLRDIGMVAIPHHILNKPTPLTPAERELLERHAEIGASITEQIPGLWQVAPIVRLHQVVYQEHPDAPVSAHIISALEDWIRVATNADVEAAEAMLLKGAGARYHPIVVQALLSEVRQRPMGSMKTLTRSAALWL